MRQTYKIGVIVGSLRQASINRRLAEAMVKLAPSHLSFEFIGLEALPMYNGDLEADRPSTVNAFTHAVAACDGLMIVTPEYNRSLPAVLKNAIDWGSKPMEANVWANQPVVICGTSPGAMGTIAAQLHLRQILGVLNAQVVGGEAYIQFKPDLLDDSGAIAVEGTRKFLSAYLERFGQVVLQLRADAG